MDFKKKILDNDNFYKRAEYALSKAISDSPPTTLQFIYKKHKIYRNKNKQYEIFDLKTKKKLFGKIKYQEMAKFIVNNLHDETKIKELLLLEEEVSRTKEKVEFIIHQLKYFKIKDILIAKLDNSLRFYEIAKQEYENFILETNI